MKVKILGSGAWEGIPAPFCNCNVCELAEENTESKDNRTRPSIQVTNGGNSFLIEISPDIRLQSGKFSLPPINDFLISHWHFDHMYGLLDLHSWSKLIMKGNLTLYCSEKTRIWLDKNFNHIPKRIAVLRPFQEFELFGIKIKPLPVYHMFSEDKDLGEDELENVFGFLLEHKKRRVVYLPDYFKVPKKTLELIKNSDILVADGTYLFEEHFPNKPEQIGEKSDPDHLHGKQILEFIKKIGAKKVVFHSISHLTEKTHEELQKMLPKNMYISYDGMEVKIF